MDPIEDRILRYAELTPDERAAVERDAAERPEWAALLAETQALDAVLAAARAAESGEDALARRVVDGALGLPDADGVVREPEAFYGEAGAMRDALDALAGGIADPVEQFERLSGFRVEGPAVPDDALHATLTAAPHPSLEALTPAPARVSAPPPAVDRPAVHRPALRLVRPTRWALAASFVLAGLYGVLGLAGRASRPEYVAMADLDAVEADDSDLVFRGDAGRPDAAQAQYAEALQMLADARRTTLGLFPRYDVDRLDAVAQRLEAAVQEAGPRSWITPEAQLVLGRVRLHQQRPADALAPLEAVVAGGSTNASEARRLLDYARASGAASADG